MIESGGGLIIEDEEGLRMVGAGFWLVPLDCHSLGEEMLREIDWVISGAGVVPEVIFEYADLGKWNILLRTHLRH